MKKNKTLLRALILAMALLMCVTLALAGCGGDDTDADASSSQPTQSATGDSSQGTDGSRDDDTTDSSTPTDSSKPSDSSKPTDSTSPNEPPDDVACEHQYGLSSRTEATCQSVSVTVETCIFCGDEKITEGTELGDHIEKEVIDKEASCTEDGIKSLVCETCGENIEGDGYDKVVPALGHNEQYDVVAPTCTEPGITNVTCSRCDYTNTKDPTEALDHDYTTFVKTVGATCVEDGYDVYKCVRCTSTQNNPTDEKAHGNHSLEYFKTVKPTCIEVGYKLYKCVSCDLTRKNPNLNTPNEPLEEDITATIDHNYDYATVDGLIACVMCGNGYRDVTVEWSKDSESFCMGCGKEPCECGSTGNWGGFTPPKDPDQLIAETLYTKTEVSMSDGTKALEIGKGLIVLSGEGDTAYIVKIYSAVDGEALKTFEESGDYVVIFLDGFDSVVKVEITASTDAFAQFYAPEE